MTSDFATKVYDILKTRVPKGKVTTYKALAEAVGTRAYRAIGQVMNKNPHSFFAKNPKDRVPCHRVISNDGTLGGFAIGDQAKIDLLVNEGIEIINKKVPEIFILRKL